MSDQPVVATGYNPNYKDAPPPYGQPPSSVHVHVSQSPPVHAQPATVVTHTTVTTQSQDSAMRQAIPELPMVLAVVLCIVNFIFPGLGTIIAGFSVLCCGNVGQSGGGRFGTFCINFWVGIAQLFLTGFFFLGWIWSIMWGYAFIASAAAASDRQVVSTTTTTMATSNVPQRLPSVY
ncbi:unnamed protein product [Clavelina lepadiformis]|uniref:Protein SPEC3 n=1 Tax=Clavelina lepadiformis TaxID=159417 RepID=A0ABP0G9L9_CLALP